MIVVGIIGILVSVAVPQFNKYQRKARQSEAKIALSAIYGLEKGFYSEYSSYSPAFDAIGYAPEGSKQYYALQGCYGASAGDSWTGTITGYTGSSAIQVYFQVGTPYAWAWTVSTSCSQPTLNCSTLGNDPQSISPPAIGMLCTGCPTDWWQINHLKILENCNSGL